MRVHQQQAYVLLNRPYSETSWLVEIFSREYGRLTLMAKGARRIKSRVKGVLLPFQPTLVSWTGKGEVPTLTSAEIDHSDFNLFEHELKGDALVCGFYCNELIVNLLHRHDPHATLFDGYHQAMISLASQNDESLLALILRDFERLVMKETGYGISFRLEADGKTEILDEQYYRFQARHGFVRVIGEPRDATLGRIIKSLAADSDQALPASERAQGKQLMRDILGHTLGRKAIVSRELFFPKVRS